jgi:hypothetical protein
MTDLRSPLSWDIRFSLLSNPNIVKSWLKAMGLTYLLCMAVLSSVFIGTGEWSALPMLMLIFAGVVSGLALLGFLIMLVVMQNHSRARFTLTDKQIIYENMDQKVKMLSKAAVVAGGIFGSGATAGSGIC